MVLRARAGVRMITWYDAQATGFKIVRNCCGGREEGGIDQRGSRPTPTTGNSPYPLAAIQSPHPRGGWLVLPSPLEWPLLVSRHEAPRQDQRQERHLELGQLQFQCRRISSLTRAALPAASPNMPRSWKRMPSLDVSRDGIRCVALRFGRRLAKASEMHHAEQRLPWVPVASPRWPVCLLAAVHHPSCHHDPTNEKARITH